MIFLINYFKPINSFFNSFYWLIWYISHFIMLLGRTCKFRRVVPTRSFCSLSLLSYYWLIWCSILQIGSILEAKSKLVLFSRKHTNAPIKYLGVVFDGQLLEGTHVCYIQQKCFKRINFLGSMVGVLWGAHPDVMLI
jgi:hypothetical protein